MRIEDYGLSYGYSKVYNGALTKEPNLNLLAESISKQKYHSAFITIFWHGDKVCYGHLIVREKNRWTFALVSAKRMYEAVKHCDWYFKHSQNGKMIGEEGRLWGEF